MKRRPKPPKPPPGALVQKTQCDTCIYRPDTGLDIKRLEDAIRDPYDPQHFARPRACHTFTGRTVICRGFWNRHADRCDLGQLATRLNAVYTIDEAGLVMHERHQRPKAEQRQTSTTTDKDNVKAERRNALALEFACERLINCINTPSNDHQVIIGGNETTRTTFREGLVDRVRNSPRLAEHFETIVVTGPGAGDGTLAELWAGALEALTRDQSSTHPEISSWMSSNSPTDHEATERLQNEVLGITVRRERKTVVVVDDLEAWNRNWSKRREDWSLRQVLQTEPKIVLVGISADWTADGDPGCALYQGLSQSRLA